jgi:hypothetical protein
MRYNPPIAMKILRRCVLGLALALPGCPPAEPPADAAAPDVSEVRVCEANGATVLMGTGTDSTARTWRPLADGDDVFLTPGPQGAQHIWIGLRARGIDPTQPRVEMTAYRASDGALIGRLRVRLRMIEAPEDGTLYALTGQTLIIEDDRYCSVLPGDIRITIDFDDGRGHCAIFERRLRVAAIDPLALEIDREARLRCCSARLLRCFPPDSGTEPPDASSGSGMGSGTRPTMDAGAVD